MAAKTGTYTLINSSTLTSATANVTFSSIPATYTDLLLIINAQSVQATTYDNVIIQFNADTGSNYSRTRINAYSGGVAGEFNGATTSHLVGPITGTSFSSSIFLLALPTYLTMLIQLHIRQHYGAVTHRMAMYS